VRESQKVIKKVEGEFAAFIRVATVLCIDYTTAVASSLLLLRFTVHHAYVEACEAASQAFAVDSARQGKQK
jgi:hypothetical protein